MSLRDLERTLRDTGDDGARTAFLWVGHGLHLQAMRESEVRASDPWAHAIRRMARAAGMRDLAALPRSQPLLLDALVHRTAATHRIRATQARAQIRRELLVALAAIERRHRLSLYGRMLALGFSNVFSFNIDRTLALHSARETFLPGSPWTTEHEFYRHSLLTGDDGGTTRVWYPHGDTRGGKRLRLGSTTLADDLMRLENARAPMMKDWVDFRVATWSYPGAVPRTQLKSPRRFYASLRRRSASWYPLAFCAPVVVVGASLAIEDWPTWWLLHQRARNLTVFRGSSVPPTFYLGVRGQIPWHLRGRPSDIQVVEFPSNDRLWAFLLRG